MVQQSLIEYIRKLLAQGYDVGTIRTTLLNAGYSPFDVDTAMRVAGAPARRISTKVLVISFLVVLILAFGILIILKLLQPPPAVLDFSLNLFSTEIAPGQSVIVNVEIRNPGGRETSGLMDYVVTGPNGKVASKTDSFVVLAQTNVPAAIPLPSTLPAGSYVFTATISYSGKSSSQSARFEVVEKAVEPVLPSDVLEEREEERARELQLTCPRGCDDLNFCTADNCVQGQCINTPIAPCCGNYKCEPGESASSCILDCAERPIGPSELRIQAKNIASSDLSKAVGVCNSLAQRTYIDACLNDVSAESGSKQPCSSVVDDDLRDSCFISFAYKNDFSVCAEISNPYMKNSCLSLRDLSATAATLPAG